MSLLALVVLSLFLVLAGLRAIDSAAALYVLADLANPYFVPAHAGLLYLWTPIVVTSASLLFLSPGLFLSLALNAAKGVGQWVLYGFALSLVVVSAVAGITQWLTGSALRGHAFAVLVFICSLGCFGFLLVRLLRGHEIAWPLAQEHARATLLSMVAVPLLLLLALTPKFYWECFNGDGASVLESARLLLVQPVPFHPTQAGEIALWPGTTSMLFAFPGSWFIRLFGEVEASARLPLLLYLVPLYGALVALIDHGRSRPVGLPERWLVWLGLVVYVIVMAFSATYSPYSADIALPATQDTLMMVCFLGFVLALLRQAWGWMWFFMALTFLSLPSGSLLICLWMLAMILVWRPRPWRQITLVAGGFLVCVVVAAILPHVMALVHLPVPGGEYGAVGTLRRFAFLQWAHWQRVFFLIVPCGILPVVALVAWRRQDRVARTLTVVTIIYFVAFYVQAHIVLHHFVPVMLLPLIVFWRSDWVTSSRYRHLTLVAAAVAAVAALLISMPQNATPHTAARLVGMAIEDRMGGYGTLDPAMFRRSEMLRHLFPYAWDPSVPFESYGGSPIAWNYYAHREKDNPHDVNYVLQSSSQPSPPDMWLLAQEDGVALYVRSDAVWDSHRAMRPPTPAGSPVYALPRGIIFRSVSLEDGLPIVNVVDVIEGFGVDMDPFLDRLGVER